MARAAHARGTPRWPQSEAEPPRRASSGPRAVPRDRTLPGGPALHRGAGGIVCKDGIAEREETRRVIGSRRVRPGMTPERGEDGRGGCHADRVLLDHVPPVGQAKQVPGHPVQRPVGDHDQPGDAGAAGRPAPGSSSTRPRCRPAGQPLHLPAASIQESRELSGERVGRRQDVRPHGHTIRARPGNHEQRS